MRATLRCGLRRGFTLIELLVVITIIAILIALLLPAVQSVRAIARTVQCANNMRQFGLAMLAYETTFKRLPNSSGEGVSGKYGYQRGDHRKGSFQVKLLPYLEAQPYYDKLNFVGDTELAIDNNTTLRETTFPVFRCPADEAGGIAEWSGKRRAQCNYVPSQGAQKQHSNGGSCTRFPGDIFGHAPDSHGNHPVASRLSGISSRSYWSATITDIRDGTSNVIAMGEIRIACCDHPNILGWYSSHNYFFHTSVPINFPTCPGEKGGNKGSPLDCNSWNNWNTSHGYKSSHAGGAQFVFCDASVHFLSETMDFRNYQRLGDRRDGEPLGEY